MYETLIYEKNNGVATIALNRPEVLNAFNGRMHEEIRETFDDAAEDDETRAIVIRGEGHGFSAGADLVEVMEHDDGDLDLGEYLRETYSRLVTRIVNIEKPVIASLHGPVYGAGMGIALACDLRIAAENAEFSVAFVKIGLMPDAGVSFFLPRVVGLGRAMEMSMLGEAVEAKEAYNIGLVNKVVAKDELADETAALARRLADLPTLALGQIKQSFHASFEKDLETALESEARDQTLCGYTNDYKEGVAAFREKRPANFTGS